MISIGPSTPRPRLTGQARTDLAASLAERYEAGASIRALASSTGRSYGLVHQLLRESGTTLRTKGGNQRKRQDGGQDR